MAIKPCTLILKETHDANLGVEVDLKKTVLAHFEINHDFKGNLNYSKNRDL